jgi:O-antigen ligase
LALRFDAAGRLLPLALAATAVLVGLLAGYDPRFAIAAALAICFVLITFADLTFGVAAFAVLAAVELVPSSSALLSVTKLAGALLAVSWLALVTTRQDERFDFVRAYPALAMVLVAFLGWALLSSVWAESSSSSFSDASRYGLNVVLFLIVFTAVRTPKHANTVAAGYLIGAAAVAAYGLLSAPAATVEGRLSGGGLDPNELAAVLVPGVVIGLGLAAGYRQNLPARLLSLGAAGFCTLSVCLTASRGGLISLAVALIATVLLARHWRPQATLAALAIALGAFFYFAAVATPEVRDRLQSTTQGQERILEGRTTIWQVGYRAFEDNPVKGVGAGNFGVASRHYLLEPGALGRSDQVIQETPAAHNAYLQIASELGLIGLALFLGIVGFCIVSAMLAARDFSRAGDRQMEILSIAVAVGTIGALAACFFISEQQSKQLWMLLGLAPAFRAIARRKWAGVQT